MWRLLLVLAGCGRIGFDTVRGMGDALSTDSPELQVCGDGIVEVPEQCDDGLNAANGACPHCLIAACGDGFVELGVEQCDEGPGANPSGACPNCQVAQCGDMLVWNLEGGTEECDHGAANGIDGVCSASCACVASPPC